MRAAICTAVHHATPAPIIIKMRAEMESTTAVPSGGEVSRRPSSEGSSKLSSAPPPRIRPLRDGRVVLRVVALFNGGHPMHGDSPAESPVTSELIERANAAQDLVVFERVITDPRFASRFFQQFPAGLPTVPHAAEELCRVITSLGIDAIVLEADPHHIALLRSSLFATVAIIGIHGRDLCRDIAVRCLLSGADLLMPRPLAVESFSSIWQHCLRRQPTFFSSASASPSVHDVTPAPAAQESIAASWQLELPRAHMSAMCETLTVETLSVSETLPLVGQPLASTPPDTPAFATTLPATMPSPTYHKQMCTSMGTITPPSVGELLPPTPELGVLSPPELVPTGRTPPLRPVGCEPRLGTQATLSAAAAQNLWGAECRIGTAGRAHVRPAATGGLAEASAPEADEPRLTPVAPLPLTLDELVRGPIPLQRARPNEPPREPGQPGDDDPSDSVCRQQ